jgi:hypothetical protein
MMDDLILPTLKERPTKTRQINFYKFVSQTEKSSTPVWDELELDMHDFFFIELESTLRLRRTNERVLFAFDAA